MDLILIVFVVSQGDNLWYLMLKIGLLKICARKILGLQLDRDLKSESNDEYCVVSKENIAL